MSIQDLGALGELIGSVAVLATLIYLTLQTRQNTMAIGAQLDAATVAANQNGLLAAATSHELMDALAEDSTGDFTANQLRLESYWTAAFTSFQWQHQQARLGLLPSFDESVMAGVVGSFFARFRSFGGWWKRTRLGARLDFVEWVEEQRSNATGRLDA